MRRAGGSRIEGSIPGVANRTLPIARQDLFSIQNSRCCCRPIADSASHDKRGIHPPGRSGAPSTAGHGLESGAAQPGNRVRRRAIRKRLDAVGRTPGPPPRAGSLTPVPTRKPWLALAAKDVLAASYLPLGRSRVVPAARAVSLVERRFGIALEVRRRYGRKRCGKRGMVATFYGDDAPFRPGPPHGERGHWISGARNGDGP